jgi:hypothetical protein
MQNSAVNETAAFFDGRARFQKPTKKVFVLFVCVYACVSVTSPVFIKYCVKGEPVLTPTSNRNKMEVNGAREMLA